MDTDTPPSDSNTDDPFIDAYDCNYATHCAIDDAYCTSDEDIPHDDGLHMTFHADKHPQSAREGVNIASSMTLKQPLVCTGGATNLPATKEDLRNGLFNDADLKE